MIQIMLKPGKTVLIDEIDIPLINHYKWYVDQDDTVIANGPQVNGKRTVLKLYRLIMNAHCGEWVDHVDHNRLNNTRSNLRIATRYQNSCNRQMGRNNAIGYKGVQLHGRKWRADITVNGKTTYIGLFQTKEEAARAYDNAAYRHFGEFAKPNFPTGGKR